MSTDKNCVFCKIIAGTIPAPKLYEDDRFICILDIQPQAKTHLLVIPKRHVASLEAVFSAHESDAGIDVSVKLVGDLFKVGTQVAREQGLLPGGFRSVINTGGNGGQTVFHLHLHLLGGESLKPTFN